MFDGRAAETEQDDAEVSNWWRRDEFCYVAVDDQLLAVFSRTGTSRWVIKINRVKAFYLRHNNLSNLNKYKKEDRVRQKLGLNNNM